MTAEKAQAILDTARECAIAARVYRRKIAEARKHIDITQKLIASYGSERVQGGKGATGLDEIIVRMEKDVAGYKQRLAEFEPVEKRARAVIQCMPKRMWFLLNSYYVKGTPCDDIAKAKHWCRATVYNQLSQARIKVKEIFD